MIEVIIIISVMLFIAVLFYKQANDTFTILQMDSENKLELPTLYQDKSPIVITNFPTPQLGTMAEIQKRPNLKGNPDILSKELGLDVWFEQTLFTHLVPGWGSRWFYTFNNSLWINTKGLAKTSAFQTLIMPTEGEISINLLVSSVNVPYLPKKWQGRSFKSLTSLDTPLINQIEFLEVKLRKGNVLLLPPHVIYDFYTDPERQSGITVFVSEIHHPISKIAG